MLPSTFGGRVLVVPGFGGLAAALALGRLILHSKTTSDEGTMRARLLPPFAVPLILTSMSHPAQAQPEVGSLKDAFLQLAARSPDPAASREAFETFSTLGTLEVSTAPLGTSTGGFTFTFDGQTGTFSRSSQTFGPSFAHRSLTTGRGRASFGLNWLHTRYSSLAGMDLDEGAVTVRNARNPLLPLSYATSTLDISSDTVVAFGSVGLTPRLDVGVAVPFVRVSFGLDVGLFTAAGGDLGHLEIPQTSASGVGDVAVFGKYHFWQRAEGGLAALIEVRLPTGNEDDLHGLGVTRTMGALVWSRGGRIAPHANVGYQFWSNSITFSETRGIEVQNELTYAFGFEAQPHARVTTTVDLVGRRLLGGGTPRYEPFVSSIPGGGTFEALVGGPESLDAVSLAPGLKWNPYGRLLVTGSLLCALKNEGLRANVVPVLGFEWAF